MNADVKQLLLQVDANVELMRRNLQSGIGSLDQFEGKATRAAQQVETSFGKIDKAANLAKTALVGFVASVGVQGIANIGRSFLQLADDIQTAADQANISVERYQTLREGLRSLELSTEQTDQILKRLSVTLGDVQSGTAAGGVIAALDRMGITARILSGEISTTDQLLDAIAQSAGRFRTEAEFTSAVVDILGRKIGVEFAASVRDGGAALREAEQAFRDTGLVIDELTIKKLADANEAWDQFVSRTRNRVLLWAVDVGEAIGAVARQIDSLRDVLAFIASPINTTIGIAQRAGRDLAEQDRQRQLARLGDLAGFRGSGTPFLRRQPRPVPVVRPTGGGAGGGSGRGAPSRSPARPAASLSDADRRLQGVAGPGILEGAGPIVDVDRFKQTFLEIRDLTKEIASATIINPDAERFAEGISQNLAQAIVYGQNIGKALVNSFKAAAAEALASGLFRLLLGGSSGGGLFGGLFSLLGNIGARANGGPVSAGRPYLVGERGPELIVPRAAGMVIPNGAFGRSAGTQVFDMRGAVVTEQLLAEINQRIVQGSAVAVGVARQDMAAARRARLPRGLG